MDTKGWLLTCAFRWFLNHVDMFIRSGAMTVRRSPGGSCKLPTRPPLQVANGGRADELEFPLENLSMCQLSSMNTASFLNIVGCCAAVRDKPTVVPGIRGHSSGSNIAGERNLTSVWCICPRFPCTMGPCAVRSEGGGRLGGERC